MWIRGSAGAGKTALVQATAEIIEQANPSQVLGCHFFFRTSANGYRGEAERWAPGLAYQMTISFPKTLPLVEKAIAMHKGLFEQQVDVVLNELFVHPLNGLLDIKPVKKPRFLSRRWWKAKLFKSEKVLGGHEV